MNNEDEIFFSNYKKFISDMNIDQLESYLEGIGIKFILNEEWDDIKKYTKDGVLFE